MDLRNLGMDIGGMGFGIDNSILSTIQDMLELSEEHGKGNQNNPSRAYVRDAKAMARTPADIKEYPDSYALVVDMPGIKANEIKVQVEDDNALVVSGERKREKEEGVKYLKMERRGGKSMRKFVLPENANLDAISVVSRDGVLTVTVQKFPAPQAKKHKTIEVKAG